MVESLKAALHSQPLRFSTLVQTQGFLHGTDSWENNGEKLAAQGVDFMDLPADRDSIFLHVMQKHPEAQGLAERVMDYAYKGKFAHKGMKPETENALRALGMEPWLMDYCNSVRYLFPKAHSVELARQGLMLQWLERHG